MRFFFVAIPAFALGMLASLIHPGIGLIVAFGVAYVGIGVTEARPERGERR